MSVDVRKLYDEEDCGWWCDYQPMIDAFGNVIIQVDDISYQGDTRVLYEKDGRIGHLIFGWGSCCYCDALQACDSIFEVQILCNELENTIRWFNNKKEALEWFENHDWAGDYSWYEGETKEYVRKVIAYLKGEIYEK